MRQCVSEKQQLLNFIDEVSFAVLDAGLYLDTHPTDVAALEYYKKYQNLRERALEEYQNNYGPLQVDGVKNSDCRWTWVDDPWPWEGGR